MFWFVCGVLLGAYSFRQVTYVDPLQDVVFAEELQKKHEFLASYYSKVAASLQKK